MPIGDSRRCAILIAALIAALIHGVEPVTAGPVNGWLIEAFRQHNTCHNPRMPSITPWQRAGRTIWRAQG
ncbi:MAG: hypothetical protein OXC07_00715 [Kistimonas sp.]|nr:hypothetical protein [Kistimonas sp.]